MEDAKAKVVDLDLNDILPNRFQPRIKFSEESIIELSESIKEHGVIQPIIVRPIGDKYEIIAGERRYKASVLAGKDTIPAIISSLNDKDCAEVALIENVQRRDLTAIEEAVSYKKILDMGYLTQEQLAVKLGKSQSAVANKIRLLNLCDDVQEALMEEKISERHARSLLKIEEADKQKEMLNRIINERLTVRKTEEEIEKMNNYMMEPNMNNNPGGFSTVNSENMATKTETPNNSNVDFNSLLMNESAKMAQAPINNAPQSGYQFDASGRVIGEPVSSASAAPTPQGGYQFDANGMVVSEPTPTSNPYGFVPMMPTPNAEAQTNNAPQSGYQFDASGRVIGEPVPSAPSASTPQGGYQFDANGMVVSEPTPTSNPYGFVPMMPTPNAEAQTNNAPQSGYQFDASGRVIGEPVPSAPAAPTPQGGYQFDANGMVVSEPKAPSMSQMPQTPIIENTTVATDSMMSSSLSSGVETNEPAPVEEKTFSVTDLLATNSQREAQNMASYFEPVTDTAVPQQGATPLMPQTPISNQELPNTFVESKEEAEPSGTEGGSSTGFNLFGEQRDAATGDSLKEEKVDIQPIIITDYSKQYDPVLPQSQQPVERIDFKQIISLIRDVNDTIEKCGYTVETEEVDLEDEYQVIFKINKN